jgi:hypothetical protein
MEKPVLKNGLSEKYTVLKRVILMHFISVLPMGALRIGEFPCRLLRTKNHHFAIAPFP